MMERMDTLIRSVQHIERHLEQLVHWSRTRPDCGGCPHRSVAEPGAGSASGFASGLSNGQFPAQGAGQGVDQYIGQGTGPKQATLPTVLSRSEWLDRQGVMDYLRISYRTYYRFKADGTLLPHRFGGRDYYFLADLEAAYRESVRKGRV